ncbi:hypothetical protein Tco_1267459, partial [Tanacetum coccineum]
ENSHGFLPQEFNGSLNQHSYPHLPLRNVTGPNSGHATNHLIGMIHFWADALLEHEAAQWHQQSEYDEDRDRQSRELKAVRLAPEEISCKLTDYERNGVTCVGMNTDIPGDPVWAVSSERVDSLIGHSLNFFFILPLLN